MLEGIRGGVVICLGVMAPACYAPNVPDCKDCEDVTPLPTNPPCGSAALLADDFEDNEFDEPWNADWDGGSVSEALGQVTLLLSGTPEGDTVRAGLVASRRTRLRDVRLSVQLVEAPAADRLGRFSFSVEDPNGSLAEWAVTAGRLQLGRGGEAPLVDEPYDPALHRFLALRETDGTLYWETSADGVTWKSAERDEAPVLELDSVRARLLGTAHAGSGDAGQIRIDDVNGGIAQGTWCPVSELKDGFEAGELAAQWTPLSSGGCSVSLSEGALAVAATGGEGVCSVRSTSRFDLRGSELVVEVPEIAGTLAATRLRLQIDPIYWIELAARNQLLVAAKSEGAPIAMETPPAYDPATQRFWRIREQDGRLEWATSADRADWTVVYTDSWMMPLGKFEAVLGVVAEEGAPASQARFDNVNL